MLKTSFILLLSTVFVWALYIPNSNACSVHTPKIVRIKKKDKKKTPAKNKKEVKDKKSDKKKKTDPEKQVSKKS